MLAGNVRIYVEGIRAYLEEFEGIDIALCVSDAAEIIDGCSDRDVNILLVDARLPGVLDSLVALRESQSDIRIVVLAVSMCREQLAGFLNAGRVNDFIMEDDSLEDLRHAVDTALTANRFSCSPKVARFLVDSSPESQISKRKLTENGLHLTQRQIHILRLIEVGKSNKEIAKSLNIEPNTVKNHVHQILQRMSVHTRCEAAAKYRRLATHL
jgi:DNA-binding NarL/FixJ family response regulator